MLSAKTRKRILANTWGKHSNTSLFIGRIKMHCHEAFEDLALIANKFEKPQIEKFFTKEKLEPFILTINRDVFECLPHVLAKIRFRVLADNIF